MKILLRVDDFPAWDESCTSFIRSDEFMRFHEILSRHDIPYLLGVTPQPSYHILNPDNEELRYLTTEEYGILKKVLEEKGEIALHGLTHQTIHPDRHTEYIGLRARRIEENILTGLSLLERGLGIRTSFFIPPFNRIDKANVKVLARFFKVICGGPESIRYLGHRSMGSNLKGATYVPSHYPFYGRAHEILPHLKRISREEMVSVTLHWEWELRRGFAEVDELCRAIKEDVVSWRSLIDER